jgi:hypothetical protein
MGIFNNQVWVRPELLVLNPSWITNNQRTSVFNFHQDFMASMHKGTNGWDT